MKARVCVKYFYQDGRLMCKICSNLTVITPAWAQWCIFIVIFEHIFFSFSVASILDFEKTTVELVRKDCDFFL